MSLFSTLFGGSTGGAERIDGAKARSLLSEGAVLVDVRSPGEFASGHIEGAQNVPVDRIATLQESVDTSTTVVVYCASGMRSARAGALLKNVGYDSVYDLGSISRW